MLVHNKGAEVAQHKVPKPITRATKSDTLWSHSQGEGFSKNDPWRRTPECGIKRDVKNGKRDEDVSALLLFCDRNAGVVDQILAYESGDDGANGLSERSPQ